MVWDVIHIMWVIIVIRWSYAMLVSVPPGQREGWWSSHCNKHKGGRWEKLVYLVTEVEWRTDLTSTMVMTIMMAIWAFECLFWFKMSGRASDKERQEDEQGGRGQVGMEAEVEWWTDIYNGSRGGVEAEVKQWYDITTTTVMISMVSVWGFLTVRPDSKEKKTVWERGGRVGESGGELYNVDHHNRGIAH